MEKIYEKFQRKKAESDCLPLLLRRNLSEKWDSEEEEEAQNTFTELHVNLKITQ